MRLSCKYDNLMSILADASFVVEDAMTKDDMRNIIFKLVKGEVNTGQIIAYNHTVIFKQFLSGEFFNITLEDSDEDVTLFQIKSKELLGFLNTYKSLRRTVADEVIFEFTPNGAIKCTVIEKDKVDEEDLLLGAEGGANNYVSQWVFRVMPIATKQLAQINTVAPEGELTTISSLNLLFHIKNLAPLLQVGNNSYSYMQFDSDYVFVVCPAYTVIMQNKVQDGDVFKGISIIYRGVNFINKLCSTVDSVQISKSQEYLYIKTEENEAYLRYDTKLSNYKAFLDAFNSKENGLAFDKLYFKDVLKRLSLENDAVEFGVDIENNAIKLSNSKFNQELPVIKLKNMEMYANTKFKAMPDIFTKALIGDDDNFEDTIFAYYCQSNGIKTVIFSDANGDWFSVIKVNMYEAIDKSSNASL